MRWVSDGAALGALHGVVDQPRELADRRGTRLLHQLEAAEDRHQQIVEVVRDAAGQLADRFHLLRLEQRLARLLERALRPRCRSVMSRVILAKPISSPSSSRIGSITTWAQKRVPSLRTRQPSLLEPALALARSASACAGSAGGAVLGGVEAREVLADDLRRA